MELSTLLSCSSERTVLFSEMESESEASHSPSDKTSGTTLVDIIHFLFWSTRTRRFMRFTPASFVHEKSIFKVAEGSSYRVDKGVAVGQNEIQLAVKHLKGPASSRTHATVLRELRILAHEPLRQNPNIVRLLGYGTEHVDFGLSLYLVAEFAEFGTLRDFLKKNSTVTLNDKANFCHDMAVGLAGLHSCGIVHGDFKLENTLVFHDSRAGFMVKLSDFGNAILDDESVYLGTRYLNAPEIRRSQLRGPQIRAQYYKCDVYSYGLAVSETLQDGSRFIDTSRHDISWLNGLQKNEPLRWSLQITQDRTLQKVLCSTLVDDPEERQHIMDVLNIFWCRNKFRERYAANKSRASTAKFPSTKVPDLDHLAFNDHLIGVPASLYAEIVSLLKQSSIPAAKFDLGICYFRGRGVDPDLHEAARLVQLAATLGDSRAEAISNRFHTALGIPTTYQSNLDAELEGLPPESYYSTRVRKYEQLEHPSIIFNLLLTDLDREASAQQMARTGDITGVQELLAAGFGINTSMPGNLLLSACRGGKPNMVAFLLRNGAKAGILGEGGITPLHWMIMFEDSELDAVITSLLAHGANINAKTSRYVQLDEHSLRLTGTPLGFAISVRNLKLVKALLKAGAELHNKPSSLDLAVSNHCPEIVSFLVSEGFKMSLHNLCGVSALKLLLLHGPLARTMLKLTIDEVLKSGVSINEQDDEGRTALANALKADDSWSEIEALVERSAVYDLNSTYLVKILGARSNPGATTEFLINKGLLKPTPEFVNAVIHRGEYEILEALLKFGIDVNDMDGSISVLQAATSMVGNARILNLLLDHGAHIQEEFNGGTVLEACISLQVSDGDMIDCLIERGAPLMSSRHVTILYRAASLHSMVDGTHVICHLLRHEMVKDLLYVGSEGRSLNTPLYNACYHGILEAVQALLEESFEMNRLDYFGGPISITELNSSMLTRSNCEGERDIYVMKLKGEDILMALYDKMEPLHVKTRLKIAAKLANYDRVVELVQGGVDVFSQYPEKDLIESQVVMQLDAPFNQGLNYETRSLEERRVIEYLLENWTPRKPEWDPILEDSPQHLQQKYLQLIEASKETSGETLETIALMSKLGEVYALQRKWVDAEAVFRQVLELRESKLEENDMSLFESRNNYIRTLTALNRLKEARVLARTTLNLALENLSPSCHYVTMARHDITVIDVAEGKVLDASDIRQSLLQRFPMEKTREIYLDELSIKANLIEDYCKFESWDDASKLGIDFREFLADARDYPQIMQLQIIVGNTFGIYSRWEDANCIFREVLKYARQTRPRSYFELLALVCLVEHWKLRKGCKECAKWQLEILEISPTVLNKVKLAEIYDADGRLIEAGLLQSQAVDTAITILGENHPTIFGLQKKLCKTWQKQGLYAHAEPLARHIVAKSIEDKAAAEHQLAVILVATEIYDEAAALIEHIVQKDCTVSLMLFLTRIYLHQNRIDEAELMCKDALSKAENAPDPEEWTIDALAQLASVYIDREDTQASCDVLNRALELARCSRPDAIFDLMLSLSFDLSALSQFDKAAVLQEELLEILSSRPSVDPIEVLKTKLALGTSYHKSGRLEEGLKLCEEAHSGITELIGDTDNLSIEVKTKLMELYYELERWEEAKPFAEDVLRFTREQVDDYDPDAVTIISFLSRIYQELELWTEAEPLFEVLLKVSRDNNGEDDNETILIMDLLAESYRRGKRFKPAEKLMIELLEKRSRLLGETHEDTIDAMETLFDLHESTKAYIEAEEIGLDLLRLYNTLEGKDETKIRKTKFSLARVYRSHGKFDEAETIAWHIYETDKEPCVDVMNCLGFTYYDQRRYAEAEPFLLKLLALQKQNAAKKTEERKSTAFDLNMVRCWKVLAYTYLHMEQWSDAKDYAELSLAGRQSLVEQKGDVEVLSAMLVLQDIHRAMEEEELVREMGRQITIEKSYFSKPISLTKTMVLGKWYIEYSS